MRRSVRAIPPILVLAVLASAALYHRAETVPLYAARTGNLCSQCHFDPNGGGPRNEFGFMFARNRHSVEPEGEGSPWKDLSIVNRVGESMPLFFSLNQRFMLLGNTSVESDSLDRLGFFNMESSIQLTFQPHSALTLVYARDAFSATGSTGGVDQKDAFGILGLPGSAGYLKVGRFRNPFGPRMDDHTVATRNGFLDFSTGESFLAQDPRQADMGIEYGLTWNFLYGRAAITNGSGNPFRGQFAETKSIKVGAAHPWYQSGLSFYDEYQKEPLGGQPKRATRWGYFALTHVGPLALIGEIAAGTDEAEPPGGGVTGPKRNLLAGFAEVDWAATRTVNFRLRYDYLNTDRSSDEDVREANTHSRYAIEGEIVPVPFAELRWVVRRIDHAGEELFGYEDETQFYAQAHFSY